MDNDDPDLINDSQEESEKILTWFITEIYTISGDHAKGIEEGVAQSVVCTESDVIESTTEIDPGNDTTQQQTEITPSSNAHEEAFNEDDVVMTVHQDSITQAEQENEEMETSRVPDSLLDISSTPLMIAHATVDFVGHQSNNFLKGCKWYAQLRPDFSLPSTPRIFLS